MKKEITLYLLLIVLFFKNASAQQLTNSQLKFLQEKVQTIYQDTLTNCDWGFLDTHLKGKNIVLLGEFTHGAKEVFQLRNQLIAYLHQQHGFDVILFESGFGELLYADQMMSSLTARSMTIGLLGNWRTASFENLMSYVKENQLSIGGYDVQRTSRTFQQYLKASHIAESIDTSAFHKLEKQFGQTQRKLKRIKTPYTSIKDEVTQLVKGYKVALQALNQLSVDSTTEVKEIELVARTIVNRIAYLNYRLAFLKDKNWNKRWSQRDSLMADNILWHINKRFSQQKVIIIGHNFHIAKANLKESVMGKWIKQAFQTGTYHIGMFGGRGTYRNNGGEKTQMSQPSKDHLDIKHVIQQLYGPAHFLDCHLSHEQGGAWLDEPITVYDSFIDLSGSKQLTLKDHFDGIITINEVSVSDLLFW